MLGFGSLQDTNSIFLLMDRFCGDEIGGDRRVYYQQEVYEQRRTSPGGKILYTQRKRYGAHKTEKNKTDLELTVISHY